MMLERARARARARAKARIGAVVISRGGVRVGGRGRVRVGYLDVGEGERALARLEVEVLGRLKVRVRHEALILQEGWQLGHGAAVGLVVVVGVGVRGGGGRSRVRGCSKVSGVAR